MYNTQYDFNILFLASQVSDKLFELDKLSALENETGFHFFRKEEEKYTIFIVEPDNTLYRSIDIRDFIKEHTNANNIKDDSRELEKLADSFIKRSRGIIQERIARSRAETARSGKLQSADRNIQEFSTYGNGGFNIGASLSQRQEQLADEAKRFIEANRDNYLKAYKKTLNPNLKDLKRELTSSLYKEDSSKNQENQNISSKPFSKFKNKLNNISQNLANQTNTNPLKDTLEIDDSKTQDKQESKDSPLKTQYHIKRNRK